MKTALVTLTIGTEAEALAAVTHPMMKAYADRIGADFRVVSTPRIKMHPKFEKFQIYDLFSEYERIIYLDTDIIVMPDCPDLLKLVPATHFGAFFDSNKGNGEADIPRWRDEEISDFQERFGEIGWKEQYFNTGVLIASRSHREVFSLARPLHAGKRFVDQTQINYNFQFIRPQPFDVGPEFNFFLALSASKERFERRFENHILHYAGFSHFYPGRSLYEQVKEDAAWIASSLATRGSAR